MAGRRENVEQVELARSFVKLAHEKAMVAIVEGIVRGPSDGVRPSAADLVDAAAQLSVDADIYKAEVPIHGGGDLASIEAVSRDISSAVDCPWVVLSAGVPAERFPRVPRGVVSRWRIGVPCWVAVSGAPLSRAADQAGPLADTCACATPPRARLDRRRGGTPLARGGVTDVNSVTGPVAAEALGFVLSHEHIACASAGIVRGWPALFGGRAALVDRATDALIEAREAAGVTTVVDATTFDLGRDMDVLAEVSTRSGVTILASTGHWLMPSPTMLARSVEQSADFFVGELVDGADGTTIRAAVIKVASEEEVLPFEERVLEAAARAHRATGAPILTHAAARYRIGERQADIFEAAGVDPAARRHRTLRRQHRPGYLLGLLRRGFRIGMDRLPNGRLPEYGPQSVDDRIAIELSASSTRGSPTGSCSPTTTRSGPACSTDDRPASPPRVQPRPTRVRLPARHP